MVWFKCQTISSTPAGGTDGPHSAQHKCKEKPPSFPLSCLSHSAPPKGESSQLGDTLGLWAGILKLPFHTQQLPAKYLLPCLSQTQKKARKPLETYVLYKDSYVLD